MALAIGQGVASLWWMESERRMIRPLARGIVMLGVVGTLFTFRQIIPPLYDAPAYQRDDYRGLVQTDPRDLTRQSGGDLERARSS
ncbi:MAG UNVERIFIED_CONTAM: hypothetical protein LVT10_09885 [Anaerolineae bacterium]